MPDAEARRDLLLELVAGPRPDVGPRLRALDPQDWAWIGATARDHRLGPLLAHRFASLPPPPDDLRAEWAGEQLRAARRWLKQRRLLHDLSGLLDARGVRHVALKGAWLALAAYPGGATRPMRDLDLLVDDVHAAAGALRAAGFARLPQYDELGEALPEDLNHAASLASPGEGAIVELHHRIDADWRGAALDAASILDRAMTVDAPAGPLRFPSPEDNFLHLVAHGALHHRFDNGPLLLSDLACLCEAAALDWAAVRDRAAETGLSRAVGLTLQLLQEVSGRPARGLSEGVFPAAPAWATAQARGLMVQAGDEVWRRRTAADTSGRAGLLRGAATALSRAAPKRRALARISGRTVEDPLIWLSAPAWFVERGRDFIAAQVDAELRGTARADARVDRWLTGR